MPDPALQQLRLLQRRQRALLTKRERQQLKRSQDLLQRLRSRHAEAAGIDPDLEDDEITESAHTADARIEMLLDGDDAERSAILGDVERLRMRGWLDAGAPGLEQALGARKEA